MHVFHRELSVSCTAESKKNYLSIAWLRGCNKRVRILLMGGGRVEVLNVDDSAEQVSPVSCRTRPIFLHYNFNLY